MRTIAVMLASWFMLVPAGSGGQPALVVVPSPDHARAFAPPADRSRFEFSVTSSSIEEAAAFYRARWPPRAEGSWVIAAGAPAEAFDDAALFDRARLARLYGGTNPRFASGPITRGTARFVVQLMSPYPEADLSRLNPGTLVMTVRE